MNKPIQKIGQEKSAERQQARTIQKLLWHLRWVLLILLIIFNGVGFITSISVHYFLALNGIGLCLYLLLGQLEDYFECKANCQI